MTFHLSVASRPASRRSARVGRSRREAPSSSFRLRRCSACSSEACAMFELDGLHSYYGKSHVVQGISLHVDEGEAVGLVGRNGVGKSTTLKSIMGLVARTQ